MNWIAFNFLRCKNDNTILIVVYAIPNRAASKGEILVVGRHEEMGMGFSKNKTVVER